MEQNLITDYPNTTFHSNNNESIDASTAESSDPSEANQWILYVALFIFLCGILIAAIALIYCLWLKNGKNRGVLVSNNCNGIIRSSSSRRHNGQAVGGKKSEFRYHALELIHEILDQPKNKRINLREFDSRLEEFKRKYPQKTQRDNYTWIQISTTARKLLAEFEPTSPGVFFVLKPDSSISNFECDLAQLFSFALSSTNNIEPLKLNENDFNEAESVTAINSKIKYYFSSGCPVLIIRNVDRIRQWEKLNLFHAFCDNDFAPYKRVCFVFTAKIPHEMDKVQNPSTLLNLVLGKAWEHISVDIRNALVARVGPCPIICP